VVEKEKARGFGPAFCCKAPVSRSFHHEAALFVAAQLRPRSDPAFCWIPISKGRGFLLGGRLRGELSEALSLS